MYKPSSNKRNKIGKVYRKDKMKTTEKQVIPFIGIKVRAIGKNTIVIPISKIISITTDKGKRKGG